MFEDQEKNFNEQWVDKYEPKNFDELILTAENKEFFKNIIKSKNLTNLTLYGNPGIGKTLTATLLAKELNAITLFVKCGVNGNIDFVRDEIVPFCQSSTIDGALKIIILDEFDSASGAVSMSKKDDDSGKATNNAMMALRSVISEHENDCRFILTCNYINKIIGPILSRCPATNLSFTYKEVLVRVSQILKAENITYTNDSLKMFLSKVIIKNFPDIRSIIQILQRCCASGTLVVNMDLEENLSDIEELAKDVWKKIQSKTKPQDVRKYVLDNKNKFNDEFSKFAGFILKQNIDSLSNEQAKNIIQKIYNMEHVIDAEIQFYGMILELY